MGWWIFKFIFFKNTFFGLPFKVSFQSKFAFYFHKLLFNLYTLTRMLNMRQRSITIISFSFYKLLFNSYVTLNVCNITILSLFFHCWQNKIFKLIMKRLRFVNYQSFHSIDSKTIVCDFQEQVPSNQTPKFDNPQKVAIRSRPSKNMV